MQLINPYEEAFSLSWFKGDLHTHSTESDGHASPAQVLARLLECGFDFAALADHNRFSPSDDESRPVMIGNSESSSAGGEVLTLFADVTPGPDEDVQSLIDRTRQSGGLPVLTHPRIGEFGTVKDHRSYPSHKLIGTYRDYAGMEIYTHNIGSGFQTAIDRLDALWISRCNVSRKPVSVWGFATSDAHTPERISPNVGILTAAEHCTGASLRRAIEKGRFYCLADSVARFAEIAVEGTILRITAVNARMLRLHGCQQAELPGERTVLAVAWAEERDTAAIEYEINGTEGFIRAEAADPNGNFIYANPIQVV